MINKYFVKLIKEQNITFNTTVGVYVSININNHISSHIFYSTIHYYHTYVSILCGDMSVYNNVIILGNCLCICKFNMHNM